MSPRAARTADARTRGWRTIAQGAAFAAITAAVMVLLPALSSARSWSDIDWRLLAFSLVQAVGTGVLSWVQRTCIDRGDPTPMTEGEDDCMR